MAEVSVPEPLVVPDSELDLTKCVVCQEDTAERSPAGSPDSESIYARFFQQVQELKDLESLPVHVCFKSTDVELIKAEGAGWHKNCRSRFTKTEIERAKKRKEKRKQEFGQGDASVKRPRQEDDPGEFETIKLFADFIRAEMFSNFENDFSDQENSVPENLIQLICYLLYGEIVKPPTQTCLSICQLIMFNSKKSKYRESTTSERSSNQYPLPTYIGLMIHNETRGKKLVNRLNSLGLSISYSAVLQLESGIESKTLDKFTENGIVIPPRLVKNRFTVAALDNFDHNPSSNSSKTSFHGTSISMHQNIPASTEVLRTRLPQKEENPDKDGTADLPQEYKTVRPIDLKNVQIKVNINSSATTDTCDEELNSEIAWLENSYQLLHTDLKNGDRISWSAYHANTSESNHLKYIQGTFPLFRESAHTHEMVYHGLSIVQKATDFINPGQTPVCAFDQPLFAIAKNLQEQIPCLRKTVIMLGGLHTEMAAWSALGELLDNSGWTTALVQSGIASTGTAESFLNAAHIKKTRHAHEVTVTALWVLQKRAYEKTDTTLDLSRWRVKMKQESPTFFFWEVIIKFELLILMFVRSHRQSNFNLYVETMEALIPLFFGLDRTNYARWLPIHVKDMKQLPPDIAEAFQNGFWTIGKTQKRFSTIPIDQAHEQTNKQLKSVSGILGFTENETLLRKWLLCAPEMAHILQAFPGHNLDESSESTMHHEEGFSWQSRVKKEVSSLVNAITEMGNPFEENSSELVTLDRWCADPEVVESIRNLESVGEKAYENYKKSNINDTIKKHSLPLLKQSGTKKRKKSSTSEVQKLKNDASLFSQMYISAQTRQSNLSQFFEHECSSNPPAIANPDGTIYTSQKSKLLECLSSDTLDERPTAFDCKIYDGVALLHILRHSDAATFGDYPEKVFVPFLKKESKNCQRIDVVWDVYRETSIKSLTREKRGKTTVRRKFVASTPIPNGWQEFLAVDENKKDLIDSVNAFIMQEDIDADLYVTSGDSVLTTAEAMSECNHEEADTRIIIHLLHALENGAKNIRVKTVDTDVIVLLVANCQQFEEYGGTIWVEFGAGKGFRYIQINAIFQNLGLINSKALPVFHAITGSDTTSSFRGIGKLKAFRTWSSHPDVTGTFLEIINTPFINIEEDDTIFKALEKFVINLYDNTSKITDVNEARKTIFCERSQSVDSIPPTKNAIFHHLKRVIYQVGIWSQSNVAKQLQPPPTQFSWTADNGGLKPVWISVPIVSKTCQELIRCKCTGPSCTRCKCIRKGLKCTDLCVCQCKKNYTD